MDLFLPIRRPGLTLGDFDFRLYAGAGALALPALTLTDTSGLGDFSVIGLPDGASWLTADLSGTTFAQSWGFTGSPSVVIIPIREHITDPGTALTLEVFRDGEPAAGVTLSAVEVGAPGDFAVSGWPIERTGAAWALSWSWAGTVGSVEWEELAAPVSATGVAPETVIRRILGAFWLKAWLGPTLSDRIYCPGRVLGREGEEISFSVEATADVAPWTPEEVRNGVGYALMRLRELDRPDTGLTCGGETSQEYWLYGLEFEFAVPSKLKGADPVSAIEARIAAIEAIFKGVSFMPVDDGLETNVLSIRQLARYPSRRLRSVDDGVWRKSFFMVQIRARVRISLTGKKEAVLP